MVILLVLPSERAASAGPIPVLADSIVLTQVIENLVSNAVKYSPPGRDIFVRLKKHAPGA